MIPALKPWIFIVSGLSCFLYAAYDADRWKQRVLLSPDDPQAHSLLHSPLVLGMLCIVGLCLLATGQKRLKEQRAARRK